MFLDEPRELLEQGDLLDDLPVVDLVDGQPEPKAIRAVILSHSCQFQPGQKVHNLHALVAEVRPASDAIGGKWGQIKAEKAWNCWYVPAGPSHPECFVDFNRVYRVERTTLFPGGQPMQRLASMTNVGREKLMYRFLSFLLHDHRGPPTIEADAG